MKNYLNRADILLRLVIQLLKVFICFMIVMLIFRIIFLVYFSAPSYFDNYLADIFMAFYVGAKYDGIVASYLVGPFLLSSFVIALLKSSKLFNLQQYILRINFVIGSMFLVFVLLSDIGFYSFFQDLPISS